jgi:TP901 family phage tail tape measure protein
MSDANAGRIRATIELSNEDFMRRMRESRREMDNMGSRSRRTSRDLGAIQKASMGMAAGIAAVIGSSVSVAATFEQSMSKLAGITNASAEDLARLEEAAREMGATTAFSASQAAEGLQYLAMAGFSVDEQIGALPAVLNAAQASGIALGESADIVSNIMTGFGIKASESGKAVDVLVKTMTTANTDLPQLGQAMKYVAPVAAGLGLSIEETAAAVAKMSDAGIQGAQAGTSLRAALLSLANPVGQTEKAIDGLGISVTDANGSMKPLPELIGHIGDKLSGMSDSQKVATASQLVGTEAASGFIALLDVGQEGLADYTRELENSAGAAETMAAKMTDNLIGAFKEFQSAAEEAGIKVGKEFLPTFTEIVKAGSDMVRTLTEVDTSTIKTGLAFAGTATSIALVVSTIGKLSLALRTMFIASGPVGIAIGALSVLGGVLMAAKVGQDEFNKVTLDGVNEMEKNRMALEGNINEYDRLTLKSRLSNDELARFVDINSEITKTADPETIARLGREQANLYEKSGLSNEELDRLVQLNGDIVAAVPESNTVLTEQGNILLENTGAAKEFNAQQVEMIRLELEAKRTKLEANMKGLLLDEKRIASEINAEKQKMVDLDVQESNQLRIIGGIEDELNAAKKAGNDSEAQQLTFNLALEKKKLQEIKDQRAEVANVVLERSKELDKVQAQIGKLDEVKYRMVEIELKQAGINSKRGEEMKTLESELTTLYKQKAEMDSIKGAAARNTAEYRQAKAEIDAKISKLEGVRGKIHSIIGTADTLNSRLGQDITKRIFIQEVGARNYTQASRAARSLGVDTTRHQGGTLPKLHVGGYAKQLAESPKHNEIDVRLLRNEMVLTESQQANLFRMIDAGITSNTSSTGGGNAELDRLIAALMNKEIRVVSELDGYVVGEAVRPFIDDGMRRDFGNELRTSGVKK